MMNTNKDNDMPDVIYAGIARSLDGEEVGGYWQANPEGEDKYLSEAKHKAEKLALLDEVREAYLLLTEDTKYIQKIILNQMDAILSARVDEREND